MSTQSVDSFSLPIAPSVTLAEPFAPAVYETAAKLGVLQHLPQVLDITREVFGAFSCVTVSEDPEFVGDVHIIFHVPARGTVEEELAREREWGRRIVRIIPRSPQVYLVFVDYPS